MSSKGIAKAGRTGEIEKNRTPSYLTPEQQEMFVERMKTRVNRSGSTFEIPTPKQLCEALKVDYLDYMRTLTCGEFPEFKAAVENLENSIVTDIRWSLVVRFNDILAAGIDQPKDLQAMVKCYNDLMNTPVKSQHVHFHGVPKEIPGAEVSSIDIGDAGVLPYEGAGDDDGLPEGF